jgi:hypothetical protein
MSNSQLKVHFGVFVPGLEPCAWLRVHAETHSWREGAVVLFDDSFEHEVPVFLRLPPTQHSPPYRIPYLQQAWNNCSAARVVLQLVIPHPQVEMDFSAEYGPWFGAQTEPLAGEEPGH